mgnify:CR=1 FL=1
MNMKKLLFVIALMVVTVFSSQAQDKRGDRPKMTPEKMAERMTQRMAEELGLNEDQKKAVHELHLESAKKRMEAMQQAKEEREAMREEMKKDREAHQKKLEEILTAEQVEKWKAIQKENRDKMRNKRGARPERGDGS